LVAAGATAVFADRALSQGFGPGSWRGGPPMLALMDPARIEDRADRMVRHLAIEVDATPEQQERLRGIVRSAVRDLVPLREKAFSTRQRAHELLTQATVERAAIEAFRAERIALADQASRRIAQALGDAAAVLTVEQRRKIADHVQARRRFMHRWHRG
jgi:Spy/CpxP family protein refolding chaperone